MSEQDQKQARALMQDVQQLGEYVSKRRNKPISIDGSAPVSKSSLHLLKTVGAYPNERMSDVAHRLHITKGAVSQLASRLQAEGLLLKQPASGSSRDICLNLTDTGMRIYRATETLDEEMERDVVGTLSELRDEDLERLRGLVQRVSSRMAAVEIPAAKAAE